MHPSTGTRSAGRRRTPCRWIPRLRRRARGPPGKPVRKSSRRRCHGAFVLRRTPLPRIGSAPAADPTMHRSFGASVSRARARRGGRSSILDAARTRPRSRAQSSCRAARAPSASVVARGRAGLGRAVQLSNDSGTHVLGAETPFTTNWSVRGSRSDSSSQRSPPEPADGAPQHQPRHPRARPVGGGCTVWTLRPLRAISDEINEFEFHISPARSSSSPQIGVGTSGTSSRTRCARVGRLSAATKRGEAAAAESRRSAFFEARSRSMRHPKRSGPWHVQTGQGQAGFYSHVVSSGLRRRNQERRRDPSGVACAGGRRPDAHRLVLSPR